MVFRRTLLTAALVTSALLIGSVGPVAAATPTVSTDTTPATCTGHWPGALNGVPTTLKAGAAAGTYLWRGAAGFSVRVTHPGTARRVFTGRIVSDKPLTVQAVRLEGKDYVALSADRKTIAYRFTNFGRIDGLNFQTACASRVQFAFNLDWVRLPRWRVWVGATNAHPLQNPFVVQRVA